MTPARLTFLIAELFAIAAMAYLLHGHIHQPNAYGFWRDLYSVLFAWAWMAGPQLLIARYVSRHPSHLVQYLCIAVQLLFIYIAVALMLDTSRHDPRSTGMALLMPFEVAFALGVRYLGRHPMKR